MMRNMEPESWRGLLEVDDENSTCFTAGRRDARWVDQSTSRGGDFCRLVEVHYRRNFHENKL